ncbi:hypothetical protein E3Q10_00679 [Wallemia mellicola]|uniref:Uncharacterized protein n=1 Tax=Wallemia mellicola TaxID=1708541 RepID=A0A4T0RQX0_9BASI|nr:hypothetical protein E3Q19_00267 [Wallemia mellicola]TIC05901.1 hypothetical protein E3Q16_01597 [Wallemia mellicola]TIC17969.1 hypothetical protein E3Q15_00298 [Wallemia mellicola]TIC33597.1 hypothetical protein E3Q10_00679 [Wallemia mellicola]TIC37867.1 hypothetical protein E3Q09_00537 [Wallemia mellicola]
MISVKLLILAFIAIIAKVSSLTINTPNGPKACEKLSITFDGGSAPYSIQVTDGIPATVPKVVDEIKDVQSSPLDYVITSKEEKIGLVLHSTDGEVAYSVSQYTTGNVDIAKGDAGC